MDKKKATIVMLCGQGLSSRIMYNSLAREFNVLLVVEEKKPMARQLIKRRIKRLGLPKVIGQLSFIAFNRLFLQNSQKGRILKLLHYYRLDTRPPSEEIVSHVDNINSGQVTAALRRHNPDAVVVNGTRIISTDVLSCIDKPFINTHVGITPRYRGVHGGYWALANRDPTHCGVTVHLIDAGIDTGGVLYQDTISVGAQDGFNTYPILQVAKAVSLMKQALTDVVENRLRVVPGVPPSQLWYHPTLSEYLMNRFFLGVK